MAPLSHFAVAALAATFVVAAPVPTQSNPATSLHARGLGWESLLQDLFGAGFGEWIPKPGFDVKEQLQNGLDYEKELNGGKLGEAEEAEAEEAEAEEPEAEEGEAEEGEAEEGEVEEEN